MKGLSSAANGEVGRPWGVKTGVYASSGEIWASIFGVFELLGVLLFLADTSVLGCSGVFELLGVMIGVLAGSTVSNYSLGGSTCLIGVFYFSGCDSNSGLWTIVFIGVAGLFGWSVIVFFNFWIYANFSTSFFSILSLDFITLANFWPISSVFYLILIGDMWDIIFEVFLCDV